MTEEEYFKRKWVREVVMNPDFKEIVNEMRQDIGLMMMMSENQDSREELYFQGKALDRVMGQLEAISNDVREFEEKLKR